MNTLRWIRTLLIAAVPLALGVPLRLHAAPVNFNVEAQPAGDALIAFSKQAATEVLFSYDDLQKVRSNPLSGAHEVEEALAILLRGTGYVPSRSAKGKYVVAAATAPVPEPARKADPPPADASPDNGEAVRLSTFVVTGSNIPTAADATDVPVTVIGARDVRMTGLNANLLDVLRKEMPQFSGRSNTGTANATNTNQNTAGGSQIALRNLDTLVLVNGRRMAVTAISAVNGKSFVDVNLIPLAEIDHIEVLTDGASAIYGSDAVGGVINIILKSNFKGAEFGGRYAFSTDSGNYSERSAYVDAGAQAQGVSITAAASWSRTDPLWQNERPFISTNLRTAAALPGYVAGNPVPTLNVAPYETALMSQEQRGAMVNFTGELAGKRLVAFGDFLYGRTLGFAQTSSFLANLAAVTVPAGTPSNTTGAAVPGVEVGSLQNPVQTFDDTTAHRGTFGFRGDINADWSWEVAGLYSRETTDQRLTDLMFAPNLTAAIAGGFDSSGNAVAGGSQSKVIAIGGYPASATTVLQPALNPFATSGINPASIANLYGTELIRTASELTSYDAKVVGSPLTLPGGKLGMAVGGSVRRESLAATPDRNSYNLSTSASNHNWGGGAIFFDPFAKSRNIDSYYGEVRAPITGGGWTLPGAHALDVSLAARSDKYSDAGKSSVPKLGLRWQPIDEQMTFRFTYSKAFTAPLIYAEYAPPSASLATGNTFLEANVLTPGGVQDPRLAQLPYYSGNGNNPQLKPAHAWSRSMGVVLSPKSVKGLTLGLDYVNVKQIGLPQGLGASNIVSSVNALGSASPNFSQIAVGGFPGLAGSTQAPLSTPGGLYNLLSSGSYQGNLYILDHNVNTGGVQVKAWDINPAYEWNGGASGKWTASTSATYLSSFTYSALPGAPFYEFAGYSTNGQTMSGTLSKWSTYTALDWSLRGWEATVANSYRSSLTDIASGQTPAIYLSSNPATPVAYYTSWDVQLGYTIDAQTASRSWNWLRGVRISVGVNNLFNRMPPYAPKSQAASLNNNNVDVATYSPVGRLLYVAGSVKF